MRKLFFTKRYRLKSRALACDCFDKCGGDKKEAYAMAVARQQEVGSVLVMLTIGVLVMQGIYYAIKIWGEMNQSKSPVLPVPGEGFELGVGEKYALTRLERKQLIGARCGN